MFRIVSFQATAIVACLVGCGLLYTAMPRQVWLRRSLPATAAVGLAIGAWLLSALLFHRAGMAAPAVVFTQLVLVMLAFTLLPFSRFRATGRNDGVLMESGRPARERPAGERSVPVRPHWIAKTALGALLGLSLAVALSGLWAWWGPGGIAAPDKVQFNMWMVTPAWMACWSLVYLARDAWRVSFVLGAANIGAWSLLVFARYGAAG